MSRRGRRKKIKLNVICNIDEVKNKLIKLNKNNLIELNFINNEIKDEFNLRINFNIEFPLNILEFFYFYRDNLFIPIANKNNEYKSEIFENILDLNTPSLTNKKIIITDLNSNVSNFYRNIYVY